MHSELAVYEHRLKAIENGRIPSSADISDDTKDKFADLEPKIKEAYIKMCKLDRILEKRVKREKEVKRERILMERR